MNRILTVSLAAAALVSLTFVSGASADSHKDKAADHGEYIRFEIDHATKGKGLVKGGFKNFKQVSGKVDLKKLSKSKAVFEVNVASIATGIPKRDMHLKSPDFFNVAKFTTAKLTVDRIKKTKAGHTARVTVDMHGVKKSVTASFKVVKEIKGGVIVEGTTSMNRRDWKVGAEPAKSGAAEVAAIKVRLAVVNK